MKNILIVLLIALTASCSEQDIKSSQEDTVYVSDSDLHKSINEIDLTDTTHFWAVKNYIEKFGKTEKVNASSIVSQESIVTYYVLWLDSTKVSTDHSNRLYMSVDSLHYGNIILENNIVTPEINYGIPDKNPESTKEKKLYVMEIYKKLITLALNQ